MAEFSQALEDFLAKVKSDPDLQAKILAATSADDALAVARDAGFELTLDDYDAYHAAGSELSDAELDEVAGGAGGGSFVKTCCAPYVSCTFK